MANSTAVDRATPWCSACNEYAEFLTRTSGTGESKRTLIICKDCNEEMWSAAYCRRQALVFKLLCLMTVGVRGYVTEGREALRFPASQARRVSNHSKLEENNTEWRDIHLNRLGTIVRRMFGRRDASTGSGIGSSV